MNTVNGTKNEVSEKYTLNGKEINANDTYALLSVLSKVGAVTATNEEKAEKSKGKPRKIYDLPEVVTLTFAAK